MCEKGETMMAKYDTAMFSATNAKAYLGYLAKHPGLRHITITRGQMEAICRDILDYADRDAEATAWAEQATRSAGEIGVIRARLADAQQTVRDYEDALCAIHHGIDHPRGRSDETADFYMAVAWFTGRAEAVLDKHGLILQEPADDDDESEGG
jgi:hypothetical protein